MIDGVPQRPGYQRISQSAKGNLMQIKGAEASAKLGATAHQNTWQRWSHGQFNYRSGSTAEIPYPSASVSFTQQADGQLARSIIPSVPQPDTALRAPSDGPF